MTTLHSTINALAAAFADELLVAMRHASPEELLSETSVDHLSRRTHHHSTNSHATRRTRIRRSPEQLQKVAEQIVAIVKAHPKGINAEAIKAKMGIKSGNVGAKVFTKPLAVALASTKVTKRGTRRATMYFA